MVLQNTAYRIASLFAAALIIPIFPVWGILAGMEGAQYVISGSLNIGSQSQIEQSPFEIYLHVLQGLLNFDFGFSTGTGARVNTIIANAYRVSVPIIVGALVIGYITGYLLGLVRSRKSNGRYRFRYLDYGFFVPIIVYSYVLVYLTSRIQLLESAANYLLASIILAIYPTFVVSKVVEQTIRKVKQSDFYLFHQSMGIPRRTIWLKACRKHFLIELLGLIQPLTVYMLGFIYFVEAPLGINGAGTMLLGALNHFDYPLITGFTITGLMLLVGISIFQELILYKINRMRYSIT